MSMCILSVDDVNWGRKRWDQHDGDTSSLQRRHPLEVEYTERFLAHDLDRRMEASYATADAPIAAEEATTCPWLRWGRGSALFLASFRSLRSYQKQLQLLIRHTVTLPSTDFTSDYESPGSSRREHLPGMVGTKISLQCFPSITSFVTIFRGNDGSEKLEDF